MVNWIIIWHYYVKAACDTSAVWSFPGRQVITILFSLSMFLFFSDLKIVLTFLFCSFPKLRLTAKAMVRRVFAGLPWLPHVRTSRSGFLLLFFTSWVNSLPPWKTFSSSLFPPAQDDGTRMSERLSQLESLRGEVLYLQSHHHSWIDDWIDDRHWHHWSNIFKGLRACHKLPNTERVLSSWAGKKFIH